MKTLIEEYRGFNIYFDTYEEVFYTSSDWRDTEQRKKSYPSIKKWIDDFIKDNEAFVPFFVERLASDYHTAQVISIIGIRKDGRFVFEKDGVKKQMSEQDEKDFIVVNAENEPIKKDIAELRAQRKELNTRIDKLETQFIRETLKDLKPRYKQ